MALDAGTHLDVGGAGVKGDMGVGGEGKKKGPGYVITSEKSGTGIKDWYQGLVWAPSLGCLDCHGMAIAEIASIMGKEHVVLSKDVSLFDTKSSAS